MARAGASESALTACGQHRPVPVFRCVMHFYLDYETNSCYLRAILACCEVVVYSGVRKRSGEWRPHDATVERREAPPPYVTGGRAPTPRRAAGHRVSKTRSRVLTHDGPPGRSRKAPRRLPALHFPRLRGRRKKGKGDARRPKFKVAGRRKRWLPAFAKASAGELIGPSKPLYRRSPPSDEGGWRRRRLFEKRI
jgi:hypothetical protein